MGGGRFTDATVSSGIYDPTSKSLGVVVQDFNRDGWPDIFFVNGHVDNNRREIGQPVDYEEIPLLFDNQFGKGAKRFRLATRDAGPYFDTKHVGRGAAFGDIMQQCGSRYEIKVEFAADIVQLFGKEHG